jgi:5-methyltetrahydropteroyltriglutamate--homocysteine methyltransferase
VAWKDWPAVEADISTLKAAVAGVTAEEFFLTSPSPGQIGRFLHNQYYRDDEAYLYALADVMKAQYEAIVNAGFVLQVDCPDLALSRHTVFSHLPLLRARPAGLSFPGANPRHEHEWKIWKEVELPAGKVLIPGVIDSTSNFVEHPELVAERIVRYASVVGRERVIAGVGARLASRELW